MAYAPTAEGHRWGNFVGLRAVGHVSPGGRVSPTSLLAFWPPGK